MYVCKICLTFQERGLNDCLFLLTVTAPLTQTLRGDLQSLSNLHEVGFVLGRNQFYNDMVIVKYFGSSLYRARYESFLYSYGYRLLAFVQYVSILLDCSNRAERPIISTRRFQRGKLAFI